MRRDLIKLFAEDYLLTPPVQKRDRDKLKHQTKYLRLADHTDRAGVTIVPGDDEIFSLSFLRKYKPQTNTSIS